MMGLTAAQIAKLAFNGAVQALTGVPLSQTAIAKAKQLWEKIKEKFQGNPIANEAIAFSNINNQSGNIDLRRGVNEKK